MNKMFPVILCGGGGTRLWPKSRQGKPKPFHRLTGEKSLFEDTLGRLADQRFAPPVVVAGAAHVDLILTQASGRSLGQLVIEPAARNTAPAIALAASQLDPDSIMIVAPSDHHVADEQAFLGAVTTAAHYAELGWLVTLGITPTAPETGFGYIEEGDKLGVGAFKVTRFIEKPDERTAESLLNQGGFSWNGGIFIFKASVFLSELKRQRPQIAQAIEQSVVSGQSHGTQFYPGAEAFNQIVGESIDYAVLENAEKVAVIPVSMGWSDIGNWQALRDAQGQDENGNAPQGEAELIDCKSVFVMSDGPRVSAIGLEDIIIVVDGNEVLVTSAKHAQKVGQLKGAKE